jgi:imidazolonepropionase-like amidohydrolase
MWRDEFDWVYREMDYGIFPVTIHPDVSGRPQVLLMLERLIGHMLKQPGVRFLTLEALTAAASTAAQLLGFADVGTLQPGKLADLVISRANPLEDIGALANNNHIEWVFKGGEPVKRPGSATA